ncbi:hypothetical protein [Streptomyces sp. LS1784]|uniref:hypothetical protein n=1 Tax=Streptomyces sp. LS1784 TaxID=2851533 RepID=UPI001CC9E12D|nr:hypothetical protein [Streptomyces sp. LS1784]
MATYELLVCDLRTDRLLDRIPVRDVSYDAYIGKTGSLSATIDVPDSAMARRVRTSVLPGRTMLYLERWDAVAGTIVWGGILWTRTPSRDARGVWTCAIQAAGLESVLRSHRMLTDSMTSTGVDQLDIARQLVAYAQSAPGGHLGVEIDYGQTSGVPRDRVYSRYDLPWIGGLIDQLAAVQNGFEWIIQCYRDATGARHRALRLGYPRLSVGGGDLVLSSPGPITTYSLPEDATRLANAWQSRGATVNSNLAAESTPLMSALLTTPTDIAAGWPRLDGTSDYSTVISQDVLDQHAQADLAAARRPSLIPSVAYTGSGVDQPQLGSYVRIRITDDWYYDGLSARYRVVGLKVSPEQRGRPESTELYLEAA